MPNLLKQQGMMCLKWTMSIKRKKSTAYTLPAHHPTKNYPDIVHPHKLPLGKMMTKSALDVEKQATAAILPGNPTAQHGGKHAIIVVYETTL